MNAVGLRTSDGCAATVSAIGGGAYLCMCVGLFLYFFPIWSGIPITWPQWVARMWLQGPIEHGWI